MASLTVLIVAVSCSVNELEQPVTETGADGLRYVEVGLKLNVDSEAAGTPDAVAQYQTKSVDDPENSADTEIKTVCVYQFLGTDDSAELIGTAEYIPDYNPSDPAKSTVKLIASDEPVTIVVLANTFYILPLGGESKTLGGFKQLFMGVSHQGDLFGIDGSVDASGTGFPDDKDYHLMFNGMTQTPVTETMSSLSVSLKRNIARIDLNIINSTSGAEAVTINDVKIFNVPKVSYFFTNYTDAPAENFPTGANLMKFGMNQEEYAPMAWEDGEGASANEKSFRFYVPANRRGVASNSTPSYKAISEHDGYSTYIQIFAEYGESHIPVTYKFYLGSNLLNDFNLIPNHTYVYNIEIKAKGDAANDPRVEDWGPVDFTSDSVERANCYILNPPLVEDYYREFRIPVDRVNKFWYNSDSGDGYEYENQINYSLRDNVEWTAYPIWSTFELTDDSFRFVKNTGIGGNDYFTVAIPKGVSGNIVIGIRRNDDPANLWSWHLWVTDYNPDSVHQAATAGKYIYPVTGGDIHRYSDDSEVFFMDRNLGALSAINYSSAIGMYYQYGRKDPNWGTETIYLYKLNPDGHSFSLDNTLVYAFGHHKTQQSETGNLASDSARNPTIIYSDWIPPYVDKSVIWADQTTKRGGAREGQKSIYDPCPPGWHVPSMKDFADAKMTANNAGNPTTNINPPSTGLVRGFPSWQDGIDGNTGLYFYPYVQNSDGSYNASKFVYYPLHGSIRPDNGKIDWGPNWGYVTSWTGTIYDNWRSYVMSCSPTSISPAAGCGNSAKETVRCVAE